MRIQRWLCVVLAGCACLPLAGQSSPRGFAPIEVRRKVALVIGNAAYADAPLRNPGADAAAIATALKALKFDEVVLQRDLNQRDMDRALDAFTLKLTTGDLALFYYAGHGMQISNENYLLPVDYHAVSEADVKYRAVSASQLRDRMEGSGARLRVLILDACRDSPFHSTRSVTRGLAQLTPQAAGTIVAFATADGKTADDNPAERNGLFTRYLLESLRTPGLAIDEIFKRTKEAVYQASGGRQLPSIYESLIGRLTLLPDAPATSAEVLDSGAENLFWQSMWDSNDRTLFEEYLRRFPHGLFVAIAKSRVAKLGSASAPPARRIPVGGLVMQGQVVKNPKPAYPALARTARVQGTVRLTAVIGVDGAVDSVKVENGHPFLLEAAMTAVKQWVYKPTLLSGKPVEVLTTIDVNFTLSQ